MRDRIDMVVAHLVAAREIRLVKETIELGSHEVAVRIAACGICSWESHFYTGEMPTPLPRALGHEGAGTVIAVGSEVTDWIAGDRVTGLFGPSFATVAKSKDSMLVPIPEHILLEHAIIEPVKCIVTCLRAARPEFGDHALVVGCGFMGLLCVAGLRSSGLASLTAIDVLDERLELARELGATNTLNPRRDNVEAQLRSITGGHGIDVAMEATGGPAGLAAVGASLRRGRPTVVLVSTSVHPDTFDLGGLQANGAVTHFAQPGHCLDPVDELRRTINAMSRGVFPMDRLITHRFRLDELSRGIEMGLARAPGYIKGIVVPD